MKFTEHLASHLTPEWRTQYICYEELKVLLEKYFESLDDAENNMDANTEFTLKFLELCQKELIKVDNFYSEKVAEAKRKIVSFMEDVEYFKELHSSGSDNKNKNSKPTDLIVSTSLMKKALINKLFKETRKKPGDISKKEMRLFMTEFYYNLVLIQNFQSLNYTGFRKILKKHDKLLNTSVGKEWFQTKVDKAKIATCLMAPNMIEEIENLFTQLITDGDKSRAMKQLRVPAFKEAPETNIVFTVGLLAGMFFMELIVSAIASSFFTEVEVIESPCFRIYKYAAIGVIFTNLASINVYAWRKKGVNHVLIFELDPRNHISPFEMMLISLLVAVIWASNTLLYNHSHVLKISEFFPALILAPILLLILVNPFPFLYRESRFWLFYQLRMTFTAPFHSIRFADFWLADQLTSMRFLFSGLPFVICFYVQAFRMSHRNIFNESNFNSTGEISDHFKKCTEYTYIFSPALSVIPFLIRALQCMRRFYDQTERKFVPHLANTCKYSISLVSGLIIYLLRFDSHNPFIVTIVVIVKLFATVYKLFWDVVMDWSLFDRKSKDFLWLREERVYSCKAYYFLALLQNFLLRFTWIQHFMNDQLSEKNRILIDTSSTFLEMYRRFVWNFFRLENEHLNNCGEFRVVRDISLSAIRIKRSFEPSIASDRGTGAEENLESMMI